jgi:ABC-type microcin C transport system duplicated ATPase subunit YejF
MQNWPFFRREPELVLTTKALLHSSVAIVGVTGVGKTRLALEALRIAHEAGSRTAHLAAISVDRSIPLLPLRPRQDSCRFGFGSESPRT